LTLFVSVALFSRNGQMTFKRPRKEVNQIVTQARKSASRFWNAAIIEPDRLLKVVVVCCHDGITHVSENTGGRRWVEYVKPYAEAAEEPHLAACLAELGVDPTKSPPAVPDVLEINGFIYRREI
jgi:hypothetical protein